MTRIAKWSAVAFSAVVLAGCATQASQMVKSSVDAVSVNSDFRVDNELGEAGRLLYVDKSCKGCHTVGLGRSSGPDLFGVVERRQLDWLKSFLKNPQAMIHSDPIAQGLYEQYNKTVMPNMHLSDADIEALIHYLQLRTNEMRAMASN
jgi:cbb3-type cytochrome oxidase cytochrome c subunit